MRKGLATSEAVVVVTGKPGVGKSTLSNRAIDAISGDKFIIRLSRMQLGHDEVLDFLLDKLDASDIPASTIRKINQSRDLLAKLANTGTRVFIVIEDAVRIGEDALAEFEALTAVDADHPAGANIILMGDDTLLEKLDAPGLLRLKQRTGLRQQVVPLSAGELQGYLKHCFRIAGGEFDLAFAAGTGQMLAELSQGNPRVANKLIESMLSAAAEQKSTKVDTALIARVAKDEHGLNIDIPVTAVAPVATAKPEPKPEPEQEQESEPEPEPELIQNTLPDLEVIAPGLAAQGLVISPESEPTPSEDDEIPTLFSSTRMTSPAVEKPVDEEPVAEEPATDPEPKPDWDRDPTLAELKPDIEALEQAMADFAVPETAPKDQKDVEAIPDIDLKDPTLPCVPELTLDTAIEQKVSEVQEELARTDAIIAANAAPKNQDSKATNTGNKPEPKIGVPPLVSPQPVAPTESDQKADAELEKIATGLANAKSIEDVDDMMAETLFGEDFSLAAAKVAAMVAAAESANEDIAPVAEGTLVANGTPVSAEEPATVKDPATNSLEEEFKAVYGENALEVSIESETQGGMDLSASQRLATVRALNTEVSPEPSAPVQQAAPTAQPAPIEDQINTSLTQTLKTLNSRPKATIEDDDDEGKSGFFSRFKRS
jgi:type II secretory pathway predicted ATPase ExeA